MGNASSCCGCSSSGRDEVDESKLHFFHGRLKVHIICAEDLPDTDTTFFNIDGKDCTDAYVTGDLGLARLFKTKYIANDLNPTWDETFDLYVCHHASCFEVRIKDKEHVGATFFAATKIPSGDLIEGRLVDGWFDLYYGDKLQGRIKMAVQYFPKENLNEREFQLPDAYFPLREGNRFLLYQDADTPQLPWFEGIECPDGSPYIATRHWVDLYNAIKNAQKFIYITGWSVYTEINLVRGDEDIDGYSNVGRLLKTKAEDGVKVLLMVWDEKLSSQSSPGLMGTHDEDTRNYFAGTAVECALMSRMKREGVLASEFVGTCYTHHQKTVICDAPLTEGSDRFRVVAFIGGIDITDGRYDSAVFPLWSTINNLHRGDFYSNCVPYATKDVGPRQPWHDCHAKVEGPAAFDIMRNFEERWRRQAEEKVQSLFHLDETEFDVEAPALMPSNEGSLWNMQLFRSITTDSCIFDFDKHKCLFSKGGRLIENTIMKALVHQIRNAKNFIYLENQYFYGSAYCWYGDQDTLTDHIIPRELTQRIMEKIAVREKFKVYILIPMFPEGDPSTAAIQEILHWQYRTMEAMYRRIARALKEFEVDAHPTDYLSFYCLAKRESPDEMPEGEFADPTPGSLLEKVRKSRRHPIYVHSKLSIFDDQYVVIGSANINQRSLGGNRDSEIAMGGYQPEHTIETQGNPRGGVHAYRLALWAAHLGEMHPDYLNPGSDECLARVRLVTRSFWDTYTAEEPQHSDIHMLPYPVKITQEGLVEALDSPWDKFPDTYANVLGVRSGYLPAKLTT